MSKIYSSLIAISFLLSFACDAQINDPFVVHLSTLKLQQEHLCYLNQPLSSSDTMQYYRAKYYLQYGQSSAFIAAVNDCKGIFLRDSLALSFANHQFLRPSNLLADYWFDSVLSHKGELSGIPLIHYSANHPFDVSTHRIPEKILPDFLRFQKASKKRPLLAATFSAFLPGSGKLYIGNYRSFALTLVSITVMGLQAWEAYAKLGVKHPLTIINAGLFTIYYGVNIFGSYRETKQKKKEIRHQYLINAANYYDTYYPARLY